MATPAAATTWERCRLCRCRLKPEDDRVRGACRDCQATRPAEAARLAVATNGTGPKAAPAAARPPAFTEGGARSARGGGGRTR